MRSGGVESPRWEREEDVTQFSAMLCGRIGFTVDVLLEAEGMRCKCGTVQVGSVRRVD